MAPGAGPRKSGRKRRPNTKYSVDAFEGLDLFDEAGTGEEPSVVAEDDDDDADGEFGINEAAEEVEAEEEDDPSGDASSNGNASAEEDAAAAEESLDEESVVGFNTGSGDVSTWKKRIKVSFVGGTQALPAVNSQTNELSTTTVRYRVRGIPDIANHAGKSTRITYTWGPAAEDLMPMVEARDRWIDQPTLPTRRVDKHGVGGFAYSVHHSEAMRQQETSTGWEWYYEQGGREVFARRQVNRFIQPEEGSSYLPKILKSSQSFLMGPYTNQKLYKLGLFASMNIAEAWNRSSAPPASGSGHNKTPKGRKEGWVLNAGAKIQGLEWAPNRRGATQYLAATSAAKVPSTEAQHAPAYTPAPASPASVQIWAFETKQSLPGTVVEMDMGRPPRLVAVFCFDWCTPKQIKWCPMPERKSSDSEDSIRLGLLAGIWADGKARVLDIRFPDSPTTQHIRMEAAVFEACPPNTVCTCLAWLSTTSIAVGCANGSVAIWNLSNCLTASILTNNPQPWFYQPLHHSYILSVISAYPSRPYLLITSSMDGYLRLTDLRAPLHDTVLSQRTRNGQTPLAWHETAQSALSADENYTMRAYPVRRFYATSAVARPSAAITAIATSPVHPFVLVACVDGHVISTNPFGKVYNSKADVWQQTWFKHEWRRPLKSENGDESHGHDGSSTASTGQRRRVVSSVLREPLIRITDGYKVERAYFATEGGYRNLQDGVLYSTTYEEQTAVTAVCWNPNLECGGWAAAGTGSGVLRIEDLAL